MKAPWTGACILLARKKDACAGVNIHFPIQCRLIYCMYYSPLSSEKRRKSHSIFAVGLAIYLSICLFGCMLVSLSLSAKSLS